MKTTVIYIVAVILSLFYVQSTRAQDTIAEFVDPGIIQDMIVSQDGNLILVTQNYVRKIDLSGEVVWSNDQYYNNIYTHEIIQRQNGNLLISMETNTSIASLYELDIETGVILDSCILSHPDHTGGDSYLLGYVEMPDQSIVALWQHYSPNLYTYIVEINQDLSAYNFVTQTDDYLETLAVINETQVMTTTYEEMFGCRVYNVSGELISNNPYSEDYWCHCLMRLDDSRFISLNESASPNRINLFFHNEMGEVLQTVEFIKAIRKGDMAVNDEDQLIYIAIQSVNKKSDSTAKSSNLNVWSVNFEGEVVDSISFNGSTDGVGICHYGDYIYFSRSNCIMRIPKSVLASIKEPKVLEANTYPNPAQDVVYFEWESQKLERGTVEIIDLQGKVVASVPIVNSSAAWSCANYVNGVYLYRITERGATVGSGKIVVRH